MSAVRTWTEAEKAFMYEYVPGHTRKEIHEEFCRRFEPRSYNSVVAFMKNHKIRTGFDGRFKKGQTSHNKGKKMPPEQYAKCRKTMFSAGHRPVNTLPVGTELELSDGYVWVKVAEVDLAKKNVNWKQKQRLIWEQQNGPVPDGCRIIFKDGNRRNFDPGNLACVTNAELARLNRYHMIADDPEITDVGITFVKLQGMIQEKAEQSRRKPCRASDNSTR